jgi:hypothetical protein
MAWEGAKAVGFHNAHHVLCAWHKIHMGIHSLRLGTFPDKDKGRAAINEVKETKRQKDIERERKTKSEEDKERERQREIQTKTDKDNDT